MADLASITGIPYSPWTPPGGILQSSKPEVSPTHHWVWPQIKKVTKNSLGQTLSKLLTFHSWWFLKISLALNSSYLSAPSDRVIFERTNIINEQIHEAQFVSKPYDNEVTRGVKADRICLFLVFPVEFQSAGRKIRESLWWAHKMLSTLASPIAAGTYFNDRTWDPRLLAKLLPLLSRLGNLKMGASNECGNRGNHQGMVLWY